MQSISETLESVKERMCSDYCKYPAHVHGMWLRDELETDKDKDEYLLSHYCENCPLSLL